MLQQRLARLGHGEPRGGRAAELRGRAQERLPAQAQVRAPALLRAARGLGARAGSARVLREREEIPQQVARAQEGAEPGHVLQHQQARGLQEQAPHRAVHAQRELRRGRGQRGGPGRVVPSHAGPPVQL